MRRAFSALNGYQYEDAYKDQVKPPHSKARFGAKEVPLLLGALKALSAVDNVGIRDYTAL
jgi:hypothetical protein